MSMTREQAWDLLTQYNQEEFHLRHAVTVEHVMRWFARELGYGDREEFWGIVGLLHDLDFERWPEEHCRPGWRRRSSGPPPATAGATVWTSSRSRRWRRSSSRWTSSPG